MYLIIFKINVKIPEIVCPPRKETIECAVMGCNPNYKILNTF